MNYKNIGNINKNNSNKVEYRKIQTIVGNISFSLILPKQYAIKLGLKKSDFVKVRQVDNKIIIEKAE